MRQYPILEIETGNGPLCYVLHAKGQRCTKVDCLKRVNKHPPRLTGRNSINAPRLGADRRPPPDPLIRVLPLPRLRSGLVPWPGVAHRASTRAFTGTSKLDREVLSRDVLLQLLLPASTENVDLSDGGFVQPWLDKGPDAGEKVRGLS